MYNGFDAREADCNDVGKLGIEHTKNKMVRRSAHPSEWRRFPGLRYCDDAINMHGSGGVRPGSRPRRATVKKITRLSRRRC